MKVTFFFLLFFFIQYFYLVELCVPFSTPIMSDVIRVQIYDDDVGKDDLISTLFFSLKEVMEKPISPY